MNFLKEVAVDRHTILLIGSVIVALVFAYNVRTRRNFRAAIG
jgi:hypothetical protein